MTLTPVTFEAFGGLNLRDDPGEVGSNEAIDLKNVDVDLGGRIRTRDGFAKFTVSTTTNNIDSIHEFRRESSGTSQVILGNGTNLRVVDYAGTTVATSTSPTASPHFFTTFGGAAGAAVYAANGTDQIRKWDGSAFSTPAGLATQDGKYLAVTPWDNRLVSARREGTTASDNPSSVRFSDEDTPETFTAANYVDLTPGDGEGISAVCSWGGGLFVFKQTKFFRFYGTSTDAENDTRFDYHTVHGQGAGAGSTPNGRSAAAGPDGVYFVNDSGLWKTTGGAAELVSEKVPILFDNSPTSYWPHFALDESVTAGGGYNHVCVVRDRVHLAYPGGTLIWTFDIPTRQWLVWQPAMASNTVQTIAPVFYPGVADHLGVVSPVLAFGGNAKHLFYQGEFTADDGTAMPSAWQSGFYDLGASEEKQVRETRVWGTGTVSLGMARDYATSTDTAVSLTLGTSPATAQALRRKAVNGTVLSHRLSASSGAWRVGRLTHEVRGSRISGVRSSQ